MSGLEIAGLVLGAIPLVIAALENYEDGLGKVKAFWKWDDQLSEAIRKLWYQYTSYELTIRVLLSSFLSDVELEMLMTDAKCHLWTDTVLETRLQSRLSTAYQAYLFTVADVEACIAEIAESLNLDHAENVTKSKLQAIVLAHPPTSTSIKLRGFEFNKRIRFTMKKKRVERLLERLDQSVARLDSFNEKTEKLEPYKSNRKAYFTTPLNLIQQYACNLHTALGSMLMCSGASTHVTNLLLEQRTIRRKGTKDSTMKESHGNENILNFTISLSDAIASWTTAEVRILETPEPAPKKRSRVQIAVSPPSPTAENTLELQYTETNGAQDIRAILKTIGTNACPGFCVDQQGQVKGVYTANRQFVPRNMSFVTLSDVISRRDPKSTQSKLTREECYVLAVTLSSSLLQLHTSPWLGVRWGKHDVAFWKDAVGDEPSRSILATVHHPHIVHVCSAQTCDDSERQGKSSLSADDSSRLLDLGILLLEIYFAQSIEEMYEPDDIRSQRNELVDLRTVKRWLNKEKGNLSWAFQNAVAHCLRCFADPNANLEDPDFRQGVIEQVLLPLQDELSIWISGPTRS